MTTRTNTRRPANSPSPAAGEAGRGYRNDLASAYSMAEGLYDNAIALSIFLDAWSKRDRTPQFTPDARDYLRHNLINAQENLDMLQSALQPSVPGLKHLHCVWTEDPTDNYWETSCHHAFLTADGTPTDNEMQYCPFCGNPIEETPWPANDVSAAAAAKANAATPVAAAPAAPSAPSNTNGPST